MSMYHSSTPVDLPDSALWHAITSDGGCWGHHFITLLELLSLFLVYFDLNYCQITISQIVVSNRLTS